MCFPPPPRSVFLFCFPLWLIYVSLVGDTPPHLHLTPMKKNSPFVDVVFFTFLFLSPFFMCIFSLRFVFPLLLVLFLTSYARPPPPVPPLLGRHRYATIGACLESPAVARVGSDYNFRSRASLLASSDREGDGRDGGDGPSDNGSDSDTPIGNGSGNGNNASGNNASGNGSVSVKTNPKVFFSTSSTKSSPPAMMHVSLVSPVRTGGCIYIYIYVQRHDSLQ